MSNSASDKGNHPLIHAIMALVGRVRNVFIKSANETENVSIMSINALIIVRKNIIRAGIEVYSFILQNNFFILKIPPDKRHHILGNGRDIFSYSLDF